MKKIDIHCHVSKRKIRDVVPEAADIPHIMKEMKKWDVEKVVLLATYFPHKSSGVSNYRLKDWMGHIPSPLNDDFFMFGSLDFDHYFYQGYNELEELCLVRSIFGIKIYTCYQNIDINGDHFKMVLNLARENNLPLMFHTGYSYASMRKYGRSTVGTPHDASSLEIVAKENPDLDMIFSHMSKPFFHEMVRVAKENDNVYTDMSGLIDSAFDKGEIPICIEEIKTFLGECGSEKLLFGTDFPVQTHEHSVTFIEEAMKTGWKRKDRENVYYNNAFNILRLEDV